MLEGSHAVLAGAVGLGLLHGIEPGHGWPLAAGYGLARAHRFAAGLAAAVLLGVGHLVSSIAVVLVFFGFKEWLALGELGWMRFVAGALLVGLGLWELRNAGGHGHAHGPAQEHSHGAAEEEAGSAAAGLRTDRGLWGIAAAAFALGFAHEEEFEILGLCAGSALCLELMLAYALAVILAIVALTMGLIAGYERFRHRLERWAPYLPALSGTILIAMGLGFAAGLL